MREYSVEEVKQIQLKILRTVDSWCRANHLIYFLAYGTLLGAVRHKGYIPWDDDIDICMLRPDYERFLREFNQDRSDTIRVLHSSIASQFPYEFAKVHNFATKLVEGIDYQYDIGLNIDIFVLDQLPNGEADGKKLIKKMTFIKRVFGAKLGHNTEKKRSLMKRGILAMVDLIPMQICTKELNRIAKTYASVHDSKWVGDVCQRWFKASEVMERCWFDQTVELEFEGFRFLAPANYDEVLTAWYGDYMQLPPVEERVTHHSYKAYQR